jgi:hypothetical protein
LDVEIFLDLATEFWKTWVTEILCIVAVSISRRQQVTEGNLRRRLGDRLSETSRIWVIPLYVWGLESSLNLINEVLYAPIGLTSLPLSYYLTWFYEVALALFFLVLLQSLAVLMVDRPSVTLGLSGGRNLAGIAVVLSLLLNSVTYLWMVQLFNKQYGIPVRLSDVQFTSD